MEANETRRKINNICESVTTQTKHIDTFLKENSGSPQWRSCTKLKDLMDSGETLSAELISICNKINENLKLAIASAHDKQVINKYTDLSKTMLDTVKEQTNLWTELSTKHMPYLCRIPDPTPRPATSAQNTQENSNVRTFEHLRPEKLTEDAEPEEVCKNCKNLYRVGTDEEGHDHDKKNKKERDCFVICTFMYC